MTELRVSQQRGAGQCSPVMGNSVTVAVFRSRIIDTPSPVLLRKTVLSPAGRRESGGALFASPPRGEDSFAQRSR